MTAPATTVPLVFSAEEKKHYLQAYGMEDYQVIALEKALQRIDFRGKRVLEIGGSNLAHEVVFDKLGAKQWVCVDLISKYQPKRFPKHYEQNPLFTIDQPKVIKILEENKYIIFNNSAEDLGPEFDSQFDVCISMFAFEHINKLRLVVENIRRALKKGGEFFTSYAVIWSCFNGHHFWHDDNWNFNQLGPIPDFAHLLMTYSELYELLAQHTDKKQAEILAYQIKANPCINRLFYEDYESIMNGAGFSECKIEPFPWSKDIDPAVRKQLEERYPHNKRFDVYGIDIYARK